MVQPNITEKYPSKFEGGKSKIRLIPLRKNHETCISFYNRRFPGNKKDL